MKKKHLTSSLLLDRVSQLNLKPQFQDKGSILKVNDGIVLADGLHGAMYGELVFFKENIYGLVFNLEENQVGIVVLGEFENLEEGDEVQTTGRVLEVGVSDKLLGRFVNPLGVTIDNKPPIEYENFLPVEKIAPGIIERQSVDTPLQTGIKAIDSMIPIGRGQRELIIGDRGIGKTAIAIDTIINQKGTNVICIYVAIGQKRAKVAEIINKLKEYDALTHTICVVASASDPASFRYLAPYVGCTIGEYFMNKGNDVLVIYDDLSKHAWAYRELSLLLRRPSGREAYPGDIFYLHSRLLERACRLNDKYGGGSMTALPIIETQTGDLSAYIPTNVISITDGQIYLEPDLFFAGIRPSLNVGLSVSRVGAAAQIKAMKSVAGKLRLDLVQYRELSAFAQFSTDLDPATKAKIERGARIVEILKQSLYQPLAVEKEVIILWAANSGEIDDIPLKYIRLFETELLEFIPQEYETIEKAMKKEQQISKSTEEQLKKAVSKFKKIFVLKYSLKSNGLQTENKSDAKHENN